MGWALWILKGEARGRMFRLTLINYILLVEYFMFHRDGDENRKEAFRKKPFLYGSEFAYFCSSTT
jgi:hypothetical protein